MKNAMFLVSFQTDSPVTGATYQGIVRFYESSSNFESLRFTYDMPTNSGTMDIIDPTTGLSLATTILGVIGDTGSQTLVNIQIGLCSNLMTISAQTGPIANFETATTYGTPVTFTDNLVGNISSISADSGGTLVTIQRAMIVPNNPQCPNVVGTIALNTNFTQSDYALIIVAVILGGLSLLIIMSLMIWFGIRSRIKAKS
jgi:hypothetical protein